MPVELSPKVIVQELALALRPVADAARQPQPDGLLAFARQAGLDLRVILADTGELGPVAEAVEAAYQPLQGIAEGHDPTAAELAALTAATREVVVALRVFDDLETVPDVDPFLAAIGRRLVDHLAISHLERRHPLAASTLRLLGVVTGTTTDARPPTMRPDVVASLVSDPGRVLRERYGWGSHHFDAYSLLANLQHVLAAVGIPAFFVDPEDHEAAILGGDPDQERPDPELWLPILTLAVDEAPVLVGLSALTVPAAGQRSLPGLAVVPFGLTAIGGRRELSAGWEVSLRSSLLATTRWGVVIRPGSAELKALADEAVPDRAHMEAGLVGLTPAEEPSLVLGDPDGSRLELPGAGIRAAASIAPDDGEVTVALPLLGCRVVVDTTGGDAFLRQLFTGKIDATFDLVPVWSSRRGLHLEGGADLSATVPIPAATGPVHVRQVNVAVATGDGKVTGRVTVTAEARLGPLAVTVEDVGFEASVALAPRDDVPLGLVDAGTRFVPPTGVAVTVDAGPLRGGGYLFFDRERSRYVGAVQLDLEGIAVNAVGLLTTRLPDGSSGWSLLVLVASHDFTPVQLGFGFTLDGVGGLLGINRRVAVDALRAGLAAGSVDALLFPDDPLVDVVRLAGELRRAFPPSPDRHLVGPAARIGWGTPTVVTGELAVMVEWPAPVRLVAVGQLRARLPTDDDAVVRLNMDAVGVVDVEAGCAALDATLFDSRLAGHVISGEAALRSRWLGDPVLVLAVGGLNPRFPRPPGFPELERVSVSVAHGSGHLLRLDAYLALTADTVQIGARLELHVAAAGFTIDGHLGFDSLLERSPFGFVAAIAGGVVLRWEGHTLAGVQLELVLSGPVPMHARGRASFHIWRFSQSVAFDVTIGSARAIPPPPPVDPLPDLLAALADRRAWAGPPPPGSRSMVTLRDARGGAAVVVHPLGELSVRQQVVPLDVEISRYAGAPLFGGPRTFTIDVSLPEAITLSVAALSDRFATGRFMDRDVAERLSGPSFERLPSGVRISADGVTFGGADDESLAATARLDYHTRVLGPDGTVHDVEGDGHVHQGPPLRAARARSWPSTARPSRASRSVRVREPSYVVARTDDLSVEVGTDDQGGLLGYTAARQALRRRAGRAAGGEAELQLVRRHSALGALPHLQRPGEAPRRPGEYLERGPFGEEVADARQVTIEPGDQPLPPTQGPGRTWERIGPPAGVREDR